MTKRYDTFTVHRPGYWLALIPLTAFGQALDGIKSDDMFLLMAVVTALGMLIITAARCRDAGLNGWWCLASVIPLTSIYFGCLRPDTHPKKLRAIEKLRVNESDLLDLPNHDAPKAPEDEHSLIDIPNSKE